MTVTQQVCGVKAPGRSTPFASWSENRRFSNHPRVERSGASPSRILNSFHESLRPVSQPTNIHPWRLTRPLADALSIVYCCCLCATRGGRLQPARGQRDYRPDCGWGALGALRQGNRVHRGYRGVPGQRRSRHARGGRRAAPERTGCRRRPGRERAAGDCPPVGRVHCEDAEPHSLYAVSTVNDSRSDSSRLVTCAHRSSSSTNNTLTCSDDAPTCGTSDRDTVMLPVYRIDIYKRRTSIRWIRHGKPP